MYTESKNEQDYVISDELDCGTGTELRLVVSTEQIKIWTCVEVMLGFPDLLHSNFNLLRYIASSTGSMFSAAPDKQIFGPHLPFCLNFFPHLSALCAIF
jgi:hypothetical protein